MSKTQINISDNVMSQIKSGKIRMRPRVYYVIGALGIIIGLAALVTISVFLISLFMFSLRTHGPMGNIRYQQLLEGIPWWTLVVATIGIFGGVLLLKKFDFSYKSNFLTIAVVFVVAIIIAGFAIDYLKIDSLWSGKRMMKGLYQEYGNNYQHRGQGRSNSP